MSYLKFWIAKEIVELLFAVGFVVVAFVIYAALLLISGRKSTSPSG